MSMATEQSFLKDVESHVIEVIRDDGTHRHIRFRKPGTMCMHFDLITWPGSLCYTGDMGTYVFERLTDMFEFFRDKAEGALRINLSYWSEKLTAVDASGRNKGSAVEFSKERFTSFINSYRVEWIKNACRGGRLSKDQRRELWEAVDHEVLAYLDDGEHAVFQRAYDFPWSPDAYNSRRDYSFEDFWDHRFEEYTDHFIWCCYALAWGIRTYDAHKAAANLPQEA